MADSVIIREIVERAVAQVFAVHAGKLHDEVIRQVCAELQPALEASASAPTQQLKAAIAAIEEAHAQSDILRALLHGTSAFCRRAALLLVRGGSAVGWQARGFRDNEAIRKLTIDLNFGLVSRVFQQHTCVAGPAAQFDPAFTARFGAPANDDCMVFPLLIRDKVPALLYADSGTEPGMGFDSSALELLVRSTGLWLEMATLRKSSAPVASASPDSSQRSEVPPASTQRTSTASAQGFNSGAGMSSTNSAASVAVAVPPAAEAVSATPIAPPASVDSETQELHRKAQRFAKLLVYEITLYNQAKVTEGRLQGDLYDRLKDDIDKSRATYDKRYGQTPVADADYFRQELLRGLADNDPTRLGSNFPR
jgi:hypothetical protein